MDKIKIIAHLADIHIRKLHRFREYRDVFKRLYKKLREVKPDLIYIGGDIAHGKLDTSPEEIRLLSDFFLYLCDIAPTLVIPGNHDCNLNNKSREDTLSPIVDLVKQINPNIHYWKKSGVYELGDCKFGFLSVFDITKEGKPNIKNLPKASDIKGDNKIAIYHGGVGRFEVDTGMWMSDDVVKSTYFDGYDLVLLGDIHKRQFLNDDKTIAYPGSLIQQNFAEVPEHGFLLWDVEKRKSEFIQVENDYGFKTVIVDNGKIQNTMAFVPKYGNVKIKHKDTSVEQLRLIELELRKKYRHLKQIVTEKIDSIGGKLNAYKNKISIDDIHDLKVQNDLIEKIIRKENSNIDDKTIQRVFDINEMTNSSIGLKNNLPRNIEWRLKYIEFDNMFSYGKKNIIDFTKLNGIIGVVAPNHSGKSALIDIIAYTIFDTCSRTFKAVEVLNNKSKNFEVKLSLEVNGVDYIIHRTGKLKVRTNRKTGQVTKLCPVSVKFYAEENGELIDLSGAARRNTQYGSGTNEEIRSILGSFDDFILTSLSLQNNGQNFVDKKQTERKQILSQFMGIDLFDKLYDIAKDDVSEEKAYFKRIREKNVFGSLSKIESTLQDLNIKKSNVEKNLEPVEKQLFGLNKEEVKLKIQLKDIEDWDDVDFDKLIIEYESKLEEQQSALTLEEEYKQNIRPLYNQIYSKLKVFDEDKLFSDFETFQDIKDSKLKKENELKLVYSQKDSLEIKLVELEKYKYDPDCEYCLKNGEHQITHKKEIMESLNKKRKKILNIEAKCELIEIDFNRLKNIEKEKQKYDLLSDDLKQIESDAYKTYAKIKETELNIETTQVYLNKCHTDKSLYEENESAIQYNQKINTELSIVKDTINVTLEAIEGLTRKLNKINSD